MKAIIAIFILITIPALAIAQGVLFFDDFNNGMDPEWLPNGGWAVEGGRLVNLTTCGFQTCMPDIWAGGSLQGDYMVSFDLTLLAPSQDSQGMSMQVYTMFSSNCEPQSCPSGSPYGYRADVGANSVCYIMRYDGNGAQNQAIFIKQVTSGGWWIPGVLYHVKFGRQGGDLVFSKWADGEPSPDLVVSVADDYYHSGYWGISFWYGLVAVDNFLVEGLGAVAVEQSSWGSMKALYR